MPADILDFNSAHTNKEHKPKQKTKSSTVQRIITNQDVFNEVREDILDRWEKHSSKNTLSAFIHSKIPAHVRGAVNADYLNDLNIISSVEKKLEMRVIMFYPDAVTPDNQHNLLVGFKRGKDVFSTPAINESEAHARALNILLYLGLEFKLKKMNRL